MIKTIYLLRHGMRLDGEDKTYWPYYAKRIHDTPLSSDGIVQAKETGEFLQHDKIDHIFSSPFFRALQTANFVAQKLNLPVNIEHGFGEMLATKWFASNPDIITQEEAVQTFSNINKDYVSFVRPTFPEDSSDIVFERVKRTLDELFQRYDGTILVVGHGASVSNAIRTLVGSKYGYNGKMAALQKFMLEDGKWKYVLSTTDHLSVVDAKYFDPKILNAIPDHFVKKNQIRKTLLPRGLA